MQKRERKIDMGLLDEIAEKQITRMEFIKLIGVALLAMTGISNFVSTLSRSTDATSRSSQANANRGFGSGKFGV